MVLITANKMAESAVASKYRSGCLNLITKAVKSVTLKSKCQKTLDELKSVQLIIELLRTEVNTHDRLCDRHADEKLKDKKCSCNNLDQILQNSVLNDLNGFDEDQLEIEAELDRRELQGLYIMAVRPCVRQMLLEVIINMEGSPTTQNGAQRGQVATIFKKGHSEVDIGMNEKRKKVTLGIPTIITSRNILEDKIMYKQCT
jgi:hypothetical protein